MPLWLCLNMFSSRNYAKITMLHVTCSTVKSGTPENMGIELGISFLAHPYVDIKLFPVWRPPSWIYSWKPLPATSFVAHLSRTLKNLGHSRWNYVATFFLRWAISISGLAATILDLQLKTTSGDVVCSTVESGIPENMGIAVGISSIAALEPEICWG